MSLEAEKQTYEKNLPEWGEYNGKYVLIKGEEVISFFDTYPDAISQGYREFGLEPFMVKRVEQVETVQYITRLAEVV